MAPGRYLSRDTSSSTSTRIPEASVSPYSSLAVTEWLEGHEGSPGASDTFSGNLKIQIGGQECLTPPMTRPWVALTLLPAPVGPSTSPRRLAWLGHLDEAVGTIAAVDTFSGTLLGISAKTGTPSTDGGVRRPRQAGSLRCSEKRRSTH